MRLGRKILRPSKGTSGHWGNWLKAWGTGSVFFSPISGRDKHWEEQENSPDEQVAQRLVLLAEFLLL